MSIHPAMIAAFMAQAPRDFDLDFRRGIYRRNGLVIPSLMGVAGISHSQSGACWEVAPDGSLKAFAANEPRLVPGLGLWARGAFTNPLRQSSAFDQAVWTKNNATVTANAAFAPDGTMTADLFNEGTATGSHSIYGTLWQPVAGNARVPVALKMGTCRYVALRGAGIYGGANWPWAVFDLQTGTVASQGADVTPTITPLSDGWFLCDIAYPEVGSASTNGNIVIAANDGAVVPAQTAPVGRSFTGTSRTFYVWQANFYQSPQRGPLIPTTTAAASNGASVMTVPFVQKDEDFVMLVGFNLAEGAVASARWLATLISNSTNCVVLRLETSGYINAYALTANVGQAAGSGGAATIASGRGVAALRYRSGRLTRAYKIGANAPNISAEGSAISLPAGLSSLHVGHSGGAGQINGLIERTRVVQGAFDDAALSNLITDMAA